MEGSSGGSDCFISPTLLRAEWIRKLLSSHMMEHCSAIEENELLYSCNNVNEFQNNCTGAPKWSRSLLPILWAFILASVFWYFPVQSSWTRKNHTFPLVLYLISGQFFTAKVEFIIGGGLYLHFIIKHLQEYAGPSFNQVPVILGAVSTSGFANRC